MHGEPALPAGFDHFGYANPAAPKGGRLVQGVLGSFDSLNPFIVRGLPPQGLRAPLVSGGNIISNTVVETLMVRGYDEPFTLYGLLAQSVETDAERILRHLRAQSRGALLRRQAGDGAGRGVLLGSCCATTAGRTTASIIPRSRRPTCWTSARCASILPARTIASCR